MHTFIIVRRSIISISLVMFTGVIAAFIPVTASAALPAGFETETLATGMVLPTAMAFAPDGRIFIAQKGGIIRVWKNGALLAQPLITLTDVNSYGDRGLIGIAVDPNFSINHYLYLSYTYENTPGANFAGKKTGHIARITVTGDTSDESTKVILVGKIGGSFATPSCNDFPTTTDCIPSDSASHSVGGVRFGPDGKLYATLGEAANFDYPDPFSKRAQDLDSLAGKMLRINTDGTAPADNPFYNGSSTANRSKIYAYGLRNQFRFNFRPTTGTLFAGDVGWSTWEEVNKITSGGNYGWPCREGLEVRLEHNCVAPNYVNPLYTYHHDVNGAGSVVGAAFGTAYPVAYANSLFIGDYAQNWIKRIVLDGSENFVSIQDFMGGADGSDGPVDISTGPDGNVYYIAIYTGSLKRILYTTGNRQPIAVIAGSPLSGVVPLTVNFSSSGSSDPDGNPLIYAWDFGDGSTSTVANPSHIYASGGNRTVSLTVFDGQGGQNTKSITIAAGNQMPTVTIVAPTTGTLYKVNDSIQLSGQALDPEDGQLLGNSLLWTIILHHNIHTHTIQTLTGTNPSFIAPDHNDTDIFTEIRLTATDSGGVSVTKSVNMYLDNNITVATNLIVNPSLETASSPTSPANWSIGGYGVNATNYTYPIVGYDGNNAARVVTTAYTDGDAKWSHDPVTVSANTIYNFTGYYKSTAAVGVIAQIGYGNGSYTYYNLGNIAPAAGWTNVSLPFTTPAGAKTAVVSFPLTSVGQIDIDLFSIMASTTSITDTQSPVISIISPLNGQTVSGVVNLLANASDNSGSPSVQFFVDGVAAGSTIAQNPYLFSLNTLTLPNGAHTITATAKDPTNNLGTSNTITLTVLNQTGVSGTTSVNQIYNPSVETTSTTTLGTPAGWFQGKFGTNNATFSYPVAGYDGAKAIQINMTTYTDGAARWYFNDILVTPGANLSFSDYYKATATSTVKIRYKLTSGAFGYVDLVALPPAAAWTQAVYSFIVPGGVTSATIFHSLYNTGSLTTDLYFIGAPGATADAVKPIVGISAPIANASISGNTVLRAQAGDTGGVAGVKFLIDNILYQSEITASPYESALDTTTLVQGTHSITAVARDNAGNISTSVAVSFIVNNTGGGVDTMAPAVTISAPANGATVQGSVNVTGNATDNIGVTALNLQIDNITVANTAAPAFSFDWNSTGAANGNHIAKVTAQDAAGNTGSSQVTINVQNATTTAGPNLIPNGNFETVNGADPQGWNRGGWGTNNRTFTYPVVGQDGQKAARVQMTTYTDGDAKWYFNKIAVVPGTQYNFSGWYKADTILDVIGEYTMASGTLLYVGIAKENQPTTTWAKMSALFTPPQGATHLTLYPLISAIGTLDIDDFSMNAMGSTTVNTDVLAPVVTITAPANGTTVYGTINISATATDNIGVTKLWFAVDGNVVSPFYFSAPYTYALNTTGLTDGVHVLKATAEDAVGNNSNGTSSIIVTHVAPPTDTTLPIVAITAPAGGSTVSGSVNLVASSSDNVGVAGVKFFVDSVQLGGEDIALPYVSSWNTASTSNGAHAIVAVSRDAAGNTATDTISLTVNNTVTASANMIGNPSVETVGTGGLPQGWSKGGWGTNNAVLSYPVSGQDGARAIQVQITSYTDGDGKWYFVPKTVVAGTPYLFTDYYTSTATSTLTAWFILSNGTSKYVDIGRVSPSAGWSQFATLITPPASTTQMTVFHELRSTGTLTTDNYSLATSTGTDPNAFTQGMVSLTFDDGWTSHYNNVLPILNAAGIKGSFEIVSSYMLGAIPANPISNPSLEATGTASTPLDWYKGGWGTNNAVLTWPVAGFSGAKAAQLTITSYTDGDAKWYAKDVSVIDGQQYNYSDYYKSDATSTITARYYMGNNVYIYSALATLPPSSSWATKPVQFVIPGNVQSITIFHALTSVGTLTIDLANLNNGSSQIFVTNGQVLDMQASGHEIGAHTQTHASLLTVPTAQMTTEIFGSRSDLLGAGISPVNVLVYPYGDYNVTVESTAQSAGFIGGRSVDRGYNTKITDKYALKVQQVDLTTTVAQIQTWIDTAKQNNTWLILMFHQVDVTGEELSITTANFQLVVNYLKANATPVVTMNQGINLMAP